MKIVSIIIVILLFTILIAHSEEKTLECTSGSGWDMADCWEDKLKVENQRMNSVLTEIRDDFVSQDLVNSNLSIQEKWRAYVEEECQLQATLSGGYGVMLKNKCLYLKTNARVEELLIHACTENGCPERKSDK